MPEKTGTWGSPAYFGCPKWAEEGLLFRHPANKHTTTVVQVYTAQLAKHVMRHLAKETCYCGERLIKLELEEGQIYAERG